VAQTAGDAVAARTEVEARPTEEDIRMRAYEKYLARGTNHGQDFDDWLEAERELRQSR
jgi:hypothetical protein